MGRQNPTGILVQREVETKKTSIKNIGPTRAPGESKTTLEEEIDSLAKG